MLSNDMIGETVCIDKTRLEDAITCQVIEFEVLDGYYLNEGHNNTIIKLLDTYIQWEKS